MFQPATLTISPFAISPPDSIHVLPKVFKPKPVACLISRLPADALPAGHDSAVPSNFPSVVRIYNSRPDTIGLRPGTMSDNSLQFDAIASYRNPYLFTDTVDYSPEGSSRFGVAADPVPYTIAADDIITALLVGCFLIAIVAMSNAKSFISRQIKTFFHITNNNNRLTSTLAETSGEIRFQLFLVAVTCILLSAFYFLYTLENVADTFILSSPYQLLIIYFSVFTAYFVVRFLLYAVVNWVFFEPVQRHTWNKSQLFLAALLGLALFPFVMSIAYFGMSLRSGLTTIAIIISIFELLTLTKCYLIFFNRNGGFLQIIIYFCALEIVPLIVLCGVLIELNNVLKISY